MADEPEVPAVEEKPVDAVPLAHDPTKPEDPTLVYLPSVVADEYGINQVEANNMVSSGKILIDGEEQPKSLSVVESKIMGKTVRIEGDIRTVQFVYKGRQRDRYTGDRFSE